MKVEIHERKLFISMWISLVCMVLRLIYDILMVIHDGLYLTGYFQMDVFLILDVIISVLIVLTIKCKSKIWNVILVCFSTIYLIDEAAGYPMASFDDLDEFVLMLSLLIIYIVMLFYEPRAFERMKI